MQRDKAHRGGHDVGDPMEPSARGSVAAMGEEMRGIDASRVAGEGGRRRATRTLQGEPLPYPWLRVPAPPVAIVNSRVW